MIGDDSDDDHCSEPMSTGKSHDRRAAPLEPQETIGRRAAGTCSAALLLCVLCGRPRTHRAWLRLQHPICVACWEGMLHE